MCVCVYIHTYIYIYAVVYLKLEIYEPHQNTSKIKKSHASTWDATHQERRHHEHELDANTGNGRS